MIIVLFMTILNPKKSHIGLNLLKFYFGQNLTHFNFITIIIVLQKLKIYF